MFDVVLFLQAIWVGLAVAAPVGPVGGLCIQRTLRFGVRVGLLSGLGAALADTFYGGCAAFGVTAVINLIESAKRPLAFVAAPVLTAMAVRMIRRARRPPPPVPDPPAPAEPASGGEPPPPPPAPGVFGAVAGTFLLTASNPATLLGFIALFGSLGLGKDAEVSWTDSVVITAGVFVGASFWWSALCFGVHQFRDRMGRRLHWMDYFVAFLLLAAAGLAVYNAVVIPPPAG
jgi:threonine/homoserine/homoserine lactone efflux protein